MLHILNIILFSLAFLTQKAIIKGIINNRFFKKYKPVKPNDNFFLLNRFLLLRAMIGIEMVMVKATKLKPKIRRKP